MGRKEILQKATFCTSLKEIHNNHWQEIYGVDQKGMQQVTPGDCLTTNFDLWIFKHISYEGLFAKFKKNNDGSWSCLGTSDEKEP